MQKKINESINKKLGLLILVFILSFVSIMLTDFIICKIVIGQNILFKSIELQAATVIVQNQQIALIIKSGFGLLGFICFLFIAKQIFAIIAEFEKVQKTLKDQNIKIIRKSIQLSAVMRQFEDQNYDLQLSRGELNDALSDLKVKEMDQRIIFDNSPLGIIRYDDKGVIRECNDKFVELMGSTREQLVGFNTANDSTPEMRKAMDRALKGEIATIENRYTSVTGGKTLEIRVVFNPVHPDRLPTPVIATVEDITKRKNAESQLKKSYSELEEIVKEKTFELVKEIDDRKAAHIALQKSEEKYRSILESIQDSYFELDEKGNLIFFNSSMPELLGYPEQELEGINYKDYTDKTEYKKLIGIFNKVYLTGQTSPLMNIHCIAKDGTRKNVGIIVSLMKNKNGDIIGFQGLARDVTEQKIMENRIQQSQKMEAIGNLAGGIAHDFNNILGGIIGYTQLIKAHTQKLPKIQQYVKQVMKASERATELVKQILLFSRKTESEKIPSDIVLIAKEVIKLLRASIPSTIEIKHHFKDGLSPVLADPTQIHQVFMNLCSNASYAMKSNGGCLDLTLTDVIVTNKYNNEFQEIKPGEYIKLSISDTGMGMDRQTIEKMFDPYFTTKEIGDGTGLGLATVHGIVKNHKGIIQVESEKGVGTTFHLFFPCVKLAVEVDKEIAEIQEGTESILFVDDEIYLARVGKEMFEDYGYCVEAVTSPTKAFELFEQNPSKFDLVITDYTMPEMTGEQLIRKIRKIDPKIPIIMCTGISLEPESLAELNISKLLMKPLDMDVMLTIIRKVLDTQKNN